MRNLILFIILFSLSRISISQEDKKEFRTIFNKSGDGKVDHGFYGSFQLGYTSINDKSAMLMGGKGAWIIDHHIAIGLSGQGFSNGMNKVDEKANGSLSGGYGGFFIEPIIAPNSPIHISFPILFGAGGVALKTDEFWSINDYEFDSFIVFEPGLDLEVNVVDFFRIALGTSYRLTNGIVFDNARTNEVPLKAIDGMNFKISFKFGKF